MIECQNLQKNHFSEGCSGVWRSRSPNLPSIWKDSSSSLTSPVTIGQHEGAPELLGEKDYDLDMVCQECRS